MSIELKQAAQDAAEAIDWLLKNIRLDAPQLSGKAMGNAEKCASALRTAIQQPVTATACGIPGMAKTTCPYCELSFAFEHEQPDAITQPTEYDYASGYAAGYAAGWNEYRDGMAWLLAATSEPNKH